VSILARVRHLAEASVQARMRRIVQVEQEGSSSEAPFRRGEKVRLGSQSYTVTRASADEVGLWEPKAGKLVLKRHPSDPDQWGHAPTGKRASRTTWYRKTPSGMEEV
jgi:hypothetical protein